MISYRPQRVLLAAYIACGLIVIAEPAGAVDLDGLDDVTMRVIDASDKATTISPKLIALPTPKPQAPASAVASNPVTPKLDSQSSRSPAPTAIGVTKSK